MPRKPRRTAADIEHDLRTLADEIRPTETRLSEAYVRRLALLVEGRSLSPPCSVSTLAEWAGSTEGAVAQVLRKHRRAAERQGGASAGVG